MGCSEILETTAATPRPHVCCSLLVLAVIVVIVVVVVVVVVVVLVFVVFCRFLIFIDVLFFFLLYLVVSVLFRLMFSRFHVDKCNSSTLHGRYHAYDSISGTIFHV